VIGKRLKPVAGPFQDRWFTIVGVAQDISPLSAGRKAANPTLYVPLAQAPVTSASLVLRTTHDAAAMVSTVRGAVARLDRQLPLFQVHTASDIGNLESVGIRLPAILMSACGISALWLAAIGAYGVLALAAKQRTQEIGIRLALGADRRNIFHMLARQGLGHIAAGISVGLLLAAVMERVLASFFGEFLHSIAIYTGVIAVMAAVGLAALVVPAVPASRLNPVDALRSE
jgi:putative ABC transport system permease protein